MPSQREPSEPLAIIGMGMRLPGKISSSEDFWKLLMNKGEGRCRVPKDRYNLNGFHSVKTRKEAVATAYGHFLDESVNLKSFDSSFFAPKQETKLLDPQQRLLMEVVWECIENAGQANIRGTNTAVYVGSYGEDWSELTHQDIQWSSPYRPVFAADFSLSNGISIEYDLRGPSMTIRTACSASMTGLHLACQALRNGDCTAAIVAGSNIILSPSMTQDMTLQGVLSPDGTCKTFDAAANGYARAEGFNAIMIKPLKDALRDKDPIRAIIRSTAANAGGKTSNIGMPNLESLETVIRHAYEAAGISDPSKTAFVECHGTGTAVGDPIEAAAIANVFGEHGIYIGSVKPNIGHTEGASGITGVIKAVLALENRMIPPNIHFNTPNPKIPFDKYKLKVPVEATPWPTDRHARVSVNCFGIGGSNAHVILDSAASYGIPGSAANGVSKSISNDIDNGIGNETTSGKDTAAHAIDRVPIRSVIAKANAHGSSQQDTSNGHDDGKTMHRYGNQGLINGHSASENGQNQSAQYSSQNRPLLLIVSAANEKSLKSRIVDTSHYIESSTSSLKSIVHTLGTRRDHLPLRSFCVVQDGNKSLEFSPPVRVSLPTPDIVFVFTGQGFHWARMGRELYECEPSFRQDILEMDVAVREVCGDPGWTFEEFFRSKVEDENESRAEFIQPLSTALQLAIVNLLSRYGIRPNVVVGHSSGEIAAAFAAGALTMRQAIICSFQRGRVLHLSRPGGMAAVGMGRGEVTPFLLPGVQVGCENSPKSVTLSGNVEVLEEVLASIRSHSVGVFTRRVNVDQAYHSDCMREAALHYEGLLKSFLSANEATIPFYSSLMGHLAPEKTDFGSAYWRANCERPVLFDGAVSALLRDAAKEQILLEVGPHSGLKSPLRQIWQAHHGETKGFRYIPTLCKGEDAMKCLMTAVGQLHSNGCPVDLSHVNPPGEVLPDLPSYPWDHSIEYWHESRLTQAWRSRAHPHHELLGVNVPVFNGPNWAWRNLLRSIDVSWLRDHAIANDVVFPCAGYIAMLGEAIRQTTGSDAYVLRNLVVKSAMAISDSETIEIMTTMRPLALTELTNSSWHEFSISSFDGSSWVQNCIAQGKAADSDHTVPADVMSALQRKLPETYLYERMERLGLNFGSRFRLLKNISAHTEAFMARAAIEDANGENDAEYASHPTSIDALLQLSVVAMSKGVSRHLGSLKVPFRIGHVYVGHGKGQLVAEAIASPGVAMGPVNATAMADQAPGRAVVKLEGVHFVRLNTGDSNEAELTSHKSVGRCTWRPDIDLYNVTALLRPGHVSRSVVCRLEKLTALCILQFLDILDTSEAMPSANSHFTKYVSWLRKQKEVMLQGNDIFVPESQHWASLDFTSREVLLEFYQADVRSMNDRSSSDIASLIASILQPNNIRAMFSDEIHPLQLLVEGDRLSGCYNHLNGLLDSKDFFTLAAHSRPKLKVLEIGAGTGGTTEIVLNNLISENGTRMYSEYMFTDISSGFFTNAKDRFQGWAGMEYKVLDITKSPTEQGFAIGEYDIVLASNVLHATSSLQDTLRNVYCLIRPGGRLYLQELVAPTTTRLIRFIMGLLPGWWVGSSDGRVDQPIVSIERWDQELQRAGFCGVEAAVANDDSLHQTMAHITSVVPAPSAANMNITLLYNRERVQFAVELAAALEKEGFLVYWLRIDDPNSSERGGHIISTIELEDPYFHEISDADFSRFMTFLSQLEGGLLWLTREAQINCSNPAYGLVIGLARTIRAEMFLDFWTAELQRLDLPAINATVAITQRFVNRNPDAGRTVDCEFAIRDGTVHIPRYDWSSMADESALRLQDNDPKKMVIDTPGLLDTMKWIQQPALDLQDDEVEVNINYTALNFRDVMIAMGLLQGVTNAFGYEAAGTITRVGSKVSHVAVGDRVMTIYRDLFTTRKVLHGALVFPVPRELSLEAAATMPLIYCTVVYAIIEKGQLERGQSVLIHSACGGVGQAAIQICKMLGADIYVTVGSEEKVQYLQDHYGLERGRIFNSRNDSFYNDVMRATNGQGVDIVLNSLSGDLLHASWRCVAKWGRMMEIGKRDMLERGHVALDMFNDNRTFYGINLDAMFERPERLYRLMQQVLQYYADGHIKPIGPIRTFSAESNEEAFRYMQSGKHMGKIVVKMPEESKSIPATQAARQVSFSNSSTYLLAGGLGGIGKSVAAWMVERGARSLLFISPSAGKSIDSQTFLGELKSQGCSAIAVPGSIAVMEDVARAIAAAPTPIAGVLQLSLILRDMPLLEIDHEAWNAVQQPKVTGTWNLHEALSGIDLDFFVLFSSVSGTLGNTGQAGYSSANTFLDSFVQYRRSLGLACSAINLGVVAGVGAVAKDQQEQFRNLGMKMLQEQQVIDAVQLSILESVPLQSAGRLSPNMSRFTTGGQFAIGMESTKPLDEPTNRHPIKFDIRTGLAWQLACNSEAATTKKIDTIRQLLTLAKANPEVLEEANFLKMMTLEIGRSLGNFMGIPEESLDVDMTLESMGVDSLVSIEIRNWWKGTLGINISVLEIMKAGTVSKLGILAVSSLRERYKSRQGETKVEEVPQKDIISHFDSYVSQFSTFTKSLKNSMSAPLPPKATIFLTGSTGYLGSEILRQLLRHSDVGVVVVLVRAETKQKGVDRIRKTAEVCGWWADSDESRVEIWLGDLSKSKLGLDNIQLGRLCGESTRSDNVDAIIHNGAVVSVTASFEELQATNVDATVELLKRTLSSKQSPRFIYVSGGLKTDRTQSFGEIAPRMSNHPGYTQTKNMAERIILTVASKIPAAQSRISVVKPGLIIGTIEGGVTNVDDIMWQAVSLAASLGRYPIMPEDRWIYICSVDESATKITEQLFDGENNRDNGGATLVDMTDGMPIRRFWEIVGEELGFAESSQPWDEWVSDVIGQSANVEDRNTAAWLRNTLAQYGEKMPKVQPGSAAETSQPQQALRSSVRYLNRIGWLKASSQERKSAMDHIIKRTGRSDPKAVMDASVVEVGEQDV